MAAEYRDLNRVKMFIILTLLLLTCFFLLNPFVSNGSRGSREVDDNWADEALGGYGGNSGTLENGGDIEVNGKVVGLNGHNVDHMVDDVTGEVYVTADQFKTMLKNCMGTTTHVKDLDFEGVTPHLDSPDMMFEGEHRGDNREYRKCTVDNIIFFLSIIPVIVFGGMVGKYIITSIMTNIKTSDGGRLKQGREKKKYDNYIKNRIKKGKGRW